MPSLAPPDYYLVVELLVSQENSKPFETLMEKLLAEDEVFKSWSLRLALKSLKSYPYIGAERYSKVNAENQLFEAYGEALPAEAPSYFRYVHLWDLREPVNIAEVMRRLGESPTYLDLNALVEREIQDMLFWVASDNLPRPPETCPLPSKDIYLRVQRKFTSPELGTYLYSAVAGSVALHHLPKPWASQGFFRHATGPLNFVTEFWRTPFTALREAPHLRKTYANALEAAKPALYWKDRKNLTEGMHQENRQPMIVPDYARAAVNRPEMELRSVPPVALSAVRSKSWLR